ncbi:MAG: hypothetical protein ABSA39_19045 [Edaphobacter sp.]
MKNTRFASILGSSVVACALMIGSLVSTQSASAQSSETIAEANIPFDFQTPTQLLPAGKYRIVHESGNLILLEGRPGKGGFVVTHDATRPQGVTRGMMVFDRYGDNYYLRQVWTAGSTSGLECAKSRAEKANAEKAKTVAKNDQALTTVELALNEVPKH